jgi:DNA-binding CsgD family transcriptional regulator
MEKLKVIIATESYVVNQGFHLIFNKLRYSHVIDKVQSILELHRLLEQEKADIILLSTSLIAGKMEMNSLLKKIGTQTAKLIAYLPNPESKIEQKNLFIESIRFDDLKEVVLSKLNQKLEEMIGENVENESSDLSEREKDILKEVAQGLTNNEIADKLFISAHTVITHRKKITKKLGIKSVSGLTVYAIINGLIEMEDVGE